jgi:hypothetical protein
MYICIHIYMLTVDTVARPCRAPCTYIYIHTHIIHTYIHTCSRYSAYIHRDIHTHIIHTYIHTCSRYSAYIQTHIHIYNAYIHTCSRYSAYIQTHIHTYNAYIHTYSRYGGSPVQSSLYVSRTAPANSPGSRMATIRVPKVDYDVREIEVCMYVCVYICMYVCRLSEC